MPHAEHGDRPGFKLPKEALEEVKQAKGPVCSMADNPWWDWDEAKQVCSRACSGASCCVIFCTSWEGKCALGAGSDGAVRESAVAGGWGLLAKVAAG